MRIGDMNKIDELCYKVYLTKKFQQDVVPLRARFGIPEDGFDSEKAYAKWQSRRILEEDNELYRQCADLVAKYHLPPDANIRLKEYVLFGTSGIRPESLDIWVPMDELGVCDIELSSKSAEQWDSSDIPFVRVIISDHANQSDAVKYIRSHWKIIQKLLDVQRGGKKKRLVRQVHDRNLTEEMLRLNKLKLGELKKLAPEGLYEYKEQAIAAIINDHSKKRVTTENVRKTIYRRSNIRDTER